MQHTIRLVVIINMQLSQLSKVLILHRRERETVKQSTAITSLITIFACETQQQNLIRKNAMQ